MSTLEEEETLHSNSSSDMNEVRQETSKIILNDDDVDDSTGKLLDAVSSSSSPPPQVQQLPQLQSLLANAQATSQTQEASTEEEQQEAARAAEAVLPSTPSTPGCTSTSTEKKPTRESTAFPLPTSASLPPPAQVPFDSASHAVASTADEATKHTTTTTATATTASITTTTSAEQHQQQQQKYLEQQSSDIAVNELKEQNAKLTRDLHRLKEHLINIEDSYTQELLLAEDREKELRNKNVHLVQQLEKLQSNNEVNGLREKLASAIVERDRALTEASLLDDRLQQASAHIERLQLVLEQTRKEYTEKLHSLENKLQRELALERDRVDQLQRRLKWQEERFAESAAALGAAGRLADQIDLKESTIRSLKDDTNRKEREIVSLKKQMEEMRLSQVDKALIKNLVISYLTSGRDKKADVELLLARVLDFNQEEMIRTKLPMTKGGGGKSGLTWHQHHHQATASNDLTAETSLSALFVQFLQNESSPESLSTLPVASASSSSSPFTSSSLTSSSSSSSLSTNTSQATLGTSLNKNSQQTKQLAKNLYQATTNSGNISGNSSNLTVVNPFVSQSLNANSPSFTSASSSSCNSSNSPGLTGSSIFSSVATGETTSATVNTLLSPLHPHPVTPLVTTTCSPSPSPSSSSGTNFVSHKNSPSSILDDCLNENSAEKLNK